MATCSPVCTRVILCATAVRSTTGGGRDAMDDDAMDVGGGDGGEGGGEEYGLSQSAPGDGATKSSSLPVVRAVDTPGLAASDRLARKAESARQARLRHKQFVGDLQSQVDAAQERVRQLESFCTTGPGSAAVAVQELQSALSAEQLQQLRQWCAAPSRAPRLTGQRPSPSGGCGAARASVWGGVTPHRVDAGMRAALAGMCAQAHRGAGRDARAQTVRERRDAPAAASEAGSECGRVEQQRSDAHPGQGRPLQRL
eukprot:6569118-Prymnesium_polylepis.1